MESAIPIMRIDVFSKLRLLSWSCSRRKRWFREGHFQKVKFEQELLGDIFGRSVFMYCEQKNCTCAFSLKATPLSRFCRILMVMSGAAADFLRELKRVKTCRRVEAKKTICMVFARIKLCQFSAKLLCYKMVKKFFLTRHFCCKYLSVISTLHGDFSMMQWEFSSN